MDHRAAKPLAAVSPGDVDLLGRRDGGDPPRNVNSFGIVQGPSTVAMSI